MTWSVEQNAITARFASASTIPTLDWSAFNLEGAERPDVNGDNAIWARLSIVPVRGSGRPLGMGLNSPSRRDGLIYIQHFAPARGGEAVLSPYVDESIGIFHRAVFSNVRCMDADSPERTIDPTGVWHQVNAIIPYFYEQWPA